MKDRKSSVEGKVSGRSAREAEREWYEYIAACGFLFCGHWIVLSLQ